MKINHHGGARAGAGRKAADGATNLVQTAVRLTQEQHAKLLRLGGSLWMRKAIDDAGTTAPKSKPAKVARVEKATQRAIDAALADLRRDAAKALEEAAQKKSAAVIAQYEAMYEEMKAKRDHYQELLEGMSGALAPEEYKRILYCLHPDHQPADRQARYASVFDIFRKRERRLVNAAPTAKKARP